MTAPPMIRFENAYQRIGSLEKTDVEVPLLPTVFDASKFAVVLFWNQSAWPYLRISGRVGGNSDIFGPDALKGVVNDPELALPAAWRETEFNADTVLAAKLIVADKLTPSDQLKQFDQLRLTIGLNTNHWAFAAEAERQRLAQEDWPESKRGLHIYLEGYLLSGEANEKVRILISMRPATLAPDHDGFVGLDLGNYNSTLACLEIGGRQPKDICVLQEFDQREQRATLVEDAPAIISLVKIRAIDATKFDSHRDSPHWIGWEIGEPARDALRRSMEGIELAPKRQLASPKYNDRVPFRVFDRMSGPNAQKCFIDVERRLPAELLACRLLQKFQEAQGRRVARLAVSYPTTFSERELVQLREVVHRGWLRSQNKLQDGELRTNLLWRAVGPSHLADVPEGVAFMLDEASAAAFYFIYQRIITAPGQLSRFRYLYPEGMNLLLYDCGGGTTDLALVRALVRESDPRKLVLTVRARAGRRDFGGDRITEAIFQLLKIRAARLLGQPQQIPQPPAGQGLSRTALDAFLKQHGAAIDQLIPTNYTERHEDRVARQERAVHLWNMAERCKQKLSEAGQDRIVISDVDWDPLQLPALQAGGRERLRALAVTRQEVDGLIEAEVRQTIDVCNLLIRNKLHDKQHTGINEEHTEPEEVHWVVAAGAACRYPLLPQMLKAELQVPFLNAEDSKFAEQRFTMDLRNLKHAVAKGLTLVLMAKECELGYRVEFDSELSKRLPFEVVYRDGEGRTRILFRENAHVDSMRDERDLIPGYTPAPPDPAEGGRPGHDVILYRKFPGDADYSKFLLYRFIQGIEGRLTIRYDPDAVYPGSGGNPFVMTNKVTFEDGECFDLTPEDTYLHPVQRGTL